jgi:trimeric autotransporter adhesin
MLDVVTGEAVAVQGTTTSSADGSVGLYGHARSTATNVYGVAGDTGSTGYGAGVIGSAYATSGTAFGGFFSAASPDGNAMFAYSSATSGYPVAVVGEVESPTGVAGSFRAHSGSGLILLGQSGPDSTNVFTVDAAGNGFYAGNLTVNGTVSKGGGSFKIDDPLDPANKTLSHSFVESPDMMNIYNGNVVTDGHGRATVELPAYFEALNRELRYQLTVIGQFAQAIVVEKVRDNRFVIKTSKPGVEVSWQVTGIRHDAYANAHRIPVEEVKSPDEQGHYLHPELFDTGAGKSSVRNASAPATGMVGPSR